MGLKKTNYEVRDLGITLPSAYAVVRKLDRFGTKGYAELWINKSREDALDKNYLERRSVCFDLVDGENPYTAAYRAALAPKTHREFYAVNPETNKEVEMGAPGAEIKFRDIPIPNSAVFDGWENDIV